MPKTRAVRARSTQGSLFAEPRASRNATTMDDGSIASAIVFRPPRRVMEDFEGFLNAFETRFTGEFS